MINFPAARHLLLPRAPRSARSARYRRITACHDRGRTGIVVLVRSARRLGCGHHGPGERHAPDRCESGELRRHRGRQRLQLRDRDRVRRPHAGQRLPAAVPAGDRQPSDLRRRGQPRVQHESPVPAELPGPDRGGDVRRPLPPGDVLLHLDAVGIEELSERVGTRSTGARPASTCSRRRGRIPRAATRATSSRTGTGPSRDARRAARSCRGSRAISPRTPGSSSSRSSTIPSTRTAAASRRTRSSAAREGSKGFSRATASGSRSWATPTTTSGTSRRSRADRSSPISPARAAPPSAESATAARSTLYAIGSGGSSCRAPRPSSNANVFHFLLVTVNGNTVTVRPTDSTGQTFDVQTYTFPGGGGGQDGVAPTAPRDLTATAASATRVDLRWTASTDNVGVTGYTIRRNGTPLTTVGGSVTAASDTSASPNTTYTYTVTAGDAAGNVSAPSNSATVTTPPGSGGGSTLVFTPTDDAYVDQGTPTDELRERVPDRGRPQSGPGRLAEVQRGHRWLRRRRGRRWP